MRFFRKRSRSVPMQAETQAKEPVHRQSVPSQTSSSGSYSALEPKNASSSSKSTTDSVSPLEEQSYFHGILPRDEILQLLQNDGDYLVRESRKGGDINIVLSVKWTTARHFIVQMEPDGKFRFEGASFTSVPKLIHYYASQGIPVTDKSGVKLKNAIKQQKWELKPHDIKLGKQLGKGNFGEVYKAVLSWRGETGLSEAVSREVAVKTCNTEMPENERRKFLREARLMRKLIHPNVVQIIGVCAVKDPIMIVMEFLPNGSLIAYLKKNRGKLTTSDKMQFMVGAALGMEYLEAQKCIHRDLAARNCLLGKQLDVKIADFGMSREAHEYKTEGTKQVPIKWTAPEALHRGSYTSKSDVWSFGVLIWETFSEGMTPYPNLTNKGTAVETNKGYRMSPPPNTPADMGALMANCWEADPDNRPNFASIRKRIESIASALGSI